MQDKLQQKSPKQKQICTLACIDKKSSRLIGEMPKQTQTFLNNMHKLLEKIEISKIRKMTKDIKMNNFAFKQYINENRISVVRYEDVLKFEQNAHQPGGTKKSQLLSHEDIRKGFWELKIKMQEYDVADILSQMKYCTEIFDREMGKLQTIGDEYIGGYLVRLPCPISKQIEINQRENGFYDNINQKEISKAMILQGCEVYFKGILSEK